MKKIIFSTTMLASFLLSNDQWKNEIDIHGGILNNSLSAVTSKYFCEHENKENLAKEILEFFKFQDEEFYKNNKYEIDRLPMQLINSTIKSNFECAQKDYVVAGSCGNWKCIKKNEDTNPKLIRIIKQEDHDEK